MFAQGKNTCRLSPERATSYSQFCRSASQYYNAQSHHDVLAQELSSPEQPSVSSAHGHCGRSKGSNDIAHNWGGTASSRDSSMATAVLEKTTQTERKAEFQEKRFPLGRTGSLKLAKKNDEEGTLYDPPDAFEGGGLTRRLFGHFFSRKGSVRKKNGQVIVAKGGVNISSAKTDEDIVMSRSGMRLSVDGQTKAGVSQKRWNTHSFLEPFPTPTPFEPGALKLECGNTSYTSTAHPKRDASPILEDNCWKWDGLCKNTNASCLVGDSSAGDDPVVQANTPKVFLELSNVAPNPNGKLGESRFRLSRRDSPLFYENFLWHFFKEELEIQHQSANDVKVHAIFFKSSYRAAFCNAVESINPELMKFLMFKDVQSALDAADNYMRQNYRMNLLNRLATINQDFLHGEAMCIEEAIAFYRGSFLDAFSKKFEEKIFPFLEMLNLLNNSSIGCPALNLSHVMELTSEKLRQDEEFDKLAKTIALSINRQAMKNAFGKASENLIEIIFVRFFVGIEFFKNLRLPNEKEDFSANFILLDRATAKQKCFLIRFERKCIMVLERKQEVSSLPELFENNQMKKIIFSNADCFEKVVSQVFFDLFEEPLSKAVDLKRAIREMFEELMKGVEEQLDASLEKIQSLLEKKMYKSMKKAMGGHVSMEVNRRSDDGKPPN